MLNFWENANKTFFGWKKSKNKVIIHWIELKNLSCPSDVRIDSRCLVKSWSDSNYHSNDTKVFVFWKKKIFSLGRHGYVSLCQCRLDHAESKSVEKISIWKNGRWRNHMPWLTELYIKNCHIFLMEFFLRK